MTDRTKELEDWDFIISNAGDDYSEETQLDNGDLFNTWFEGKYINPIRQEARKETLEEVEENLKKWIIDWENSDYNISKLDYIIIQLAQLKGEKE